MSSGTPLPLEDQAVVLCPLSSSTAFQKYKFPSKFHYCMATINTIEIPHIRQKSDWDCGIACVEMILRKYLGQEFNEEILDSLGKGLGFGTGVWTIDLANILVHFNIVCVYHTITCGVDPGYRNEEYYKTCFETDEVRVTKLFESARELGLNVVKGSVTMETILSKLDHGWTAIVLVNSNLLRCTPCEEKQQNVVNVFPWTVPSLHMHQVEQYEGHYVTLCGYDLERKTIFYKNPSREDTQCCTDISLFELARHSYGTDEDIIFIDLKTGARYLEATGKSTCNVH